MKKQNKIHECINKYSNADLEWLEYFLYLIPIILFALYIFNDELSQFIILTPLLNFVMKYDSIISRIPDSNIGIIVGFIVVILPFFLPILMYKVTKRTLFQILKIISRYDENLYKFKPLTIKDIRKLYQNKNDFIIQNKKNKILEIGELHINSNNILVFDPISKTWYSEIYNVKNGLYKVKAIISEDIQSKDKRISMLEIMLQDSEPTDFRNGILGTGKRGIDIDFGTIAIMSGDLKDSIEIGQEDFNTMLAALDENYVNTCSYVQFENIILSTTGYGDGYYRFYTGLQDDDLVVIYIDFEVLSSLG
jgi:hypothetical protein